MGEKSYRTEHNLAVGKDEIKELKNCTELVCCQIQKGWPDSKSSQFDPNCQSRTFCPRDNAGNCWLLFVAFTATVSEKAKQMFWFSDNYLFDFQKQFWCCQYQTKSYPVYFYHTMPSSHLRSIHPHSICNSATSLCAFSLLLWFYHLYLVFYPFLSWIIHIWPNHHPILPRITFAHIFNYSSAGGQPGWWWWWWWCWWWW